MHMVLQCCSCEWLIDAEGMDDCWDGQEGVCPNCGAVQDFTFGEIEECEWEEFLLENDEDHHPTLAQALGFKASEAFDGFKDLCRGFGGLFK